MGVNIEVERKHIYLISAVFVFLIGVGLVIGGAGLGTSHNPGHDLDTIRGFKTGEIDLGDSLTNIEKRIIALESGSSATTGAIVGGGSETGAHGGCNIWGTASCGGFDNRYVQCPAGSTKRTTGTTEKDDMGAIIISRTYYICVKD